LNILIHAMMYPEGEKDKRANTSLFLHEYAVQWKKAGHDVRVIHHKMAYPAWMERCARLAAKLFPLQHLREFISGYGCDEECRFERDEIPVVRRNLGRLVPKTFFRSGTIAGRGRWVREYLNSEGFVPDLVIADFVCPSMQIAAEMKKDIAAPVALILHDTCTGYLSRKWTGKRAEGLVRCADTVAFRSLSAKKEFEKEHFIPFRSFLMPSGIAEEMCVSQCDERRTIKRYVAVGRLIGRKYFDRTVEAFGQANCPDAELILIGDGPERAKIEEVAARQPNAERIHILGQLPREEVFRELEKADAFVMLSENETFGMVYVEAMSRGAIPIASVNEGADGLILDGENGFLLPAGDTDALCALFKKLDELPENEVQRLSRNAWKTAENMTQGTLAQAALENMQMQEKPAKIAFFTRGYPLPSSPAHQVFVQRLVHGMADEGVDVHVIYPVALHKRKALGAPKSFTEWTEGGRRVEVHCPSRLSLGWYPLTAWSFERAAAREVKRLGIRPDALYAHFAVPPGTSAAKIGEKMGIPAFFAYGESTPQLLHKYGRKRAGRAMKDLSGVVAVSTAAKNEVISLGLADECKIKVFPNAVDPAQFSPRDKMESRKKMGIAPDAFVLAFVGAFSERKGVLRANEAIARVDGAKGIFAGKGEQMPQGEHVLFTGPVKPENMAEFLSAADAFILPTRNEGCCNAIIEAMACGLPLITSDRDFNCDIAGEDNAILIDPDDIDAMARAISLLKGDPERCRRMGQASLLRAQELTISARTKGILRFLHERMI